MLCPGIELGIGLNLLQVILPLKESENIASVGESRRDLREGSRLDSGDIIDPLNPGLPETSAFPRFFY